MGSKFVHLSQTGKILTQVDSDELCIYIGWPYQPSYMGNQKTQNSQQNIKDKKSQRADTTQLQELL